MLVDTGSARIFTKLRATAQGTAPLVAEIVVGELAEALGLVTPARCLVEIDRDVESADPHEELAELLARSHGLNLGFEYLSDFRDLKPADTRYIPRALAPDIVWLDAVVQNPDRTLQNPNLMIKAGRVVLIDHGAALTFQYDWDDVTELTPRQPGSFVENHLLQVPLAELEARDHDLAPKLSRELIERALARVPDEFLSPLLERGSNLLRLRAAYVAYLWKRLRSPRPFVNPGRSVPFRIGR